MFQQIVDNVRKKPALVHCITNYVTVNDCANMVLACGASPIMADDKGEVEEITSICTSLVINIGTLNKRTVESMILAGKKANELGHPVILDPVGAGASSMRTDTVFRLLKEVKFSVIKGNISEIKTVFAGSGNTQGVDADAADIVTEDNLQESIAFARNLSKKLGAVIAITGAIDLVVSEEKAYVIRNGHPMMSRITGSGCMLAALMGAYVGSNPDHLLEAAAAAVSVEGICGEKAAAKVEKEGCGTGMFRTYLIDEMSKIIGQEADKEQRVVLWEE